MKKKKNDSPCQVRRKGRKKGEKNDAFRVSFCIFVYILIA